MAYRRALNIGWVDFIDCLWEKGNLISVNHVVKKFQKSGFHAKKVIFWKRNSESATAAAVSKYKEVINDSRAVGLRISNISHFWSTWTTHSHGQSWSLLSHVSSVRSPVSTFQKLVKQNKLHMKLMFATGGTFGSGRGDHWWHVLLKLISNFYEGVQKRNLKSPAIISIHFFYNGICIIKVIFQK